MSMCKVKRFSCDVETEQIKLFELRGVSEGQDEQFIKIFPQESICNINDKGTRKNKKKPSNPDVREFHYVSFYQKRNETHVCGWMVVLLNKKMKTAYISKISTLAAVKRDKYKGTGRRIFNQLLAKLPKTYIIYLYPLDKDAKEVYKAWDFTTISDDLDYMVYQKESADAEILANLERTLRKNMESSDSSVDISEIKDNLDDDLLEFFERALKNEVFVNEILPGFKDMSDDDEKAELIMLYGGPDFVEND
jgi:hypothetical protein